MSSNSSRRASRVASTSFTSSSLLCLLARARRAIVAGVREWTRRIWREQRPWARRCLNPAHAPCPRRPRRWIQKKRGQTTTSGGKAPTQPLVAQREPAVCVLRPPRSAKTKSFRFLAAVFLRERRCCSLVGLFDLTRSGGQARARRGRITASRPAGPRRVACDSTDPDCVTMQPAP